MTRKEKELKLLEMFDLKVGDTVKINDLNTYQIVEEDNCFRLKKIDKTVSLSALLQYNFEKVTAIKLGEVVCLKMDCELCPFFHLRCDFSSSSSISIYDNLFKIFNFMKKKYDNASQRYITVDWDAIKAELDKDIEVKNNGRPK